LAAVLLQQLQLQQLQQKLVVQLRLLHLVSAVLL
jgi:hypothetical protein